MVGCCHVHLEVIWLLIERLWLLPRDVGHLTESSYQAEDPPQTFRETSRCIVWKLGHCDHKPILLVPATIMKKANHIWPTRASNSQYCSYHIEAVSDWALVAPHSRNPGDTENSKAFDTDNFSTKHLFHVLINLSKPSLKKSGL